MNLGRRIEIFAAILGKAMLERSYIPEMLAIPRELFPTDVLQETRDSIEKLYANKEPVDWITVYQNLKTRNIDVTVQQIVRMVDLVSEHKHNTLWVVK